MELRKVQLTGGSSIAVTLPKSWIQRARILPGDVVGCAPQADGSLAIFPHAKGDRVLQEYELALTDKDPELVFRKLIAAYLSGYDVIRITSKGPISATMRHEIRRVARRVMGLEIVEERPNGISLQDFLDPREFHMEKAVRRMGLLTQAMQEEAIQALKDPVPEHVESVDERDDEVDRLYWLVNKQYHALLRDASFASKTGLTASQALNFLLAARLIERTADHADRLGHEAVALAEAKIPATFVTRLEKQARRATQLFQEALTAFLKRDSTTANDLIGQASKALDANKKLLQDATSLGGTAVSHVSFILESIGRTAAYAADLGEVTINYEVTADAKE